MKKLLVAFVIIVAFFTMTDTNIKAEQQTNCCSDCCRWDEGVQDCTHCGDGSFCLDVKRCDCEPCVVVK